MNTSAHHASCEFEVEWPTITLMLAVYGAWIAVTLGHGLLPGWGVLLIGGWSAAWHASLQHEAIHLHPTRSERLNALLMAWPLLLWLPYGVYRRDHLLHHRDLILTDPFDDPESFYVAGRRWARWGGARRALYWVLNSLAGRLIFGPPVYALAMWAREVRRLVRGDFDRVGDVLWYLGGLALVLYWLIVITGMPVWLYVLCVAYPGTALLLLRSFHEHRAAEIPNHRTALVESRGPLAWLFLNNNLHVAHHAVPGVPWYRLPGLVAEHRATFLADNGGFRFAGYGEIARRFLFRCKDSPRHPLVD